MSTLSPVEPTTTFISLETVVCEAQQMVDVLYALIDDIFGVEADEQGRYVMSASEGARLLFLSSMAMAMTNKAAAAYYVAFENEHRAEAVCS